MNGRNTRTKFPWAGALAGFAGVAVALAFGELIASITVDVPSLVVAVSELIIDYTPGDVMAFSIENIGSVQKTLLILVVVIVSLLIGSFLGWFATHGQTTQWQATQSQATRGEVTHRQATQGQKAVAVAGFIVFGIIGGWATARNPTSSALISWAVVIIATTSAISVMLTLIQKSITTHASADYQRASDDETSIATHAAPANTQSDNDANNTQSKTTTQSDSADNTTQNAATQSKTTQSEQTLLSEQALLKKERREFLVWASGAGAAVLAMLGGGRLIRTLRGPSTAEIARNNIQLPPSRPGNLQSSGLNGITGGGVTGEQPGASGQQPETGVLPSNITPQDATTLPSDASEVLGSLDASPALNTRTIGEQLASLNTLDDVAGVSSYISSNKDFYRIDTAAALPEVDPATWSLKFTGMIDNPYELTYDEILKMDLTDHVITLSCVSNPVGGIYVDNAVWTGVPLSVLLDRAKVQPGANQVVGRSVDDWTAGFPIETIYDGRNAILAIGMNGEPLPVKHGFPARIVVAGLYGYVSAVKWLKEIRLTTWNGFDGYWVPRGWAKEGPIKTQSRIDVPKAGANIKAGQRNAIAGIAWSPTRGISKVEVRINSIGNSGGNTATAATDATQLANSRDWFECETGGVLGNESWVQWVHHWTPSTPGDYDISVRATDGEGATQSSTEVSPRPNGAEGWHTIRVKVQQ